jgi:hypothetical protein
MKRIALLLAAAAPVVAGAVAVPAGAAPAPAPAAVSLSYNCTASIGSLTLGVKVTGSTVSTVADGKTIRLHNAQWSVTIPATWVNKLIQFTKATSASGKATNLNFTATHATTATVNAAATPIAFGPIPLVLNKPAVLHLPAAPATVGPWTASGSKGQVMRFTPGLAVITVKVATFTGTATCKPATHPVIASSTIT